MGFTHTTNSVSTALGFKNGSRISQLRAAGELEGCYKPTGNAITPWLYDADLVRARLDEVLAPWNRNRRGLPPGEKAAAKMIKTKRLKKKYEKEFVKKQKAIEEAGDGIKTIGYARAREINEQYRAALAKLEYEERSGKLIDVEKAKKAAAHAGRVIKENMSAVADRCASLVAAESDSFECRKILQKEINFVLENISSGLLDFDAD